MRRSGPGGHRRRRVAASLGRSTRLGDGGGARQPVGHLAPPLWSLDATCPAQCGRTRRLACLNSPSRYPIQTRPAAKQTNTPIEIKSALFIKTPPPTQHLRTRYPPNNHHRTPPLPRTAPPPTPTAPSFANPTATPSHQRPSALRGTTHQQTPRSGPAPTPLPPRRPPIRPSGLRGTAHQQAPSPQPHPRHAAHPSTPTDPPHHPPPTRRSAASPRTAPSHRAPAPASTPPAFQGADHRARKAIRASCKQAPGAPPPRSGTLPVTPPTHPPPRTATAPAPVRRSAAPGPRAAVLPRTYPGMPTRPRPSPLTRPTPAPARSPTGSLVVASRPRPASPPDRPTRPLRPAARDCPASLHRPPCSAGPPRPAPA
jgi:hypothetical protein